MMRRWNVALLSMTLTAGTLLGAPAATAAPLGTLGVNDASVYAGTEVKFVGRLPERVSSRKIVLQVRKSGAWRTVQRSYTNRGGKFVVKQAMDYTAGRYTFRVLGKRSRLFGVGESKTRPVTVTVSNRPGSQSAPLRPGQRFAMAEWSVALGVTDQDAWPELAAANEYEDPPAAGWAYISVPMSFTRTGADSGHLWIDGSLAFVGNDGVVYTSLAEVNGETYSCYLPNDWSDAPELYPGASAVATDCLMVRQGAIAGGLWRMSDYETEHFITQS